MGAVGSPPTKTVSVRVISSRLAFEARELVWWSSESRFRFGINRKNGHFYVHMGEGRELQKLKAEATTQAIDGTFFGMLGLDSDH